CYRLKSQVTEKIMILNEFVFSVSEDFLPRLLVPDAEFFQSGDENDIAFQVGVFSLERWNQNTTLLVDRTFTRTAEIIVLKHHHFVIKLWFLPNLFFVLLPLIQLLYIKS